jgi:hypothetical protein
MWGRCLNAGQTCIAADYVLCHRNVADAFAGACAAALTEFFGSDNAGAQDNLSRIVAERHYDRLADLLKRTCVVAQCIVVAVIHCCLAVTLSQAPKEKLWREAWTNATAKPLCLLQLLYPA